MVRLAAVVGVAAGVPRAVVMVAVQVGAASTATVPRPAAARCFQGVDVARCNADLVVLNIYVVP